ncbi:hypothetical protein Cpir12675_002902 [Ceratocystis pirilliformis]|uniref:IBR domain-containing protein n=1 Tax=Ceratocystis pirilliformis TaxID=259994 RepID=A0ABR3Z781_9PEZI
MPSVMDNRNRWLLPEQSQQQASEQPVQRSHQILRKRRRDDVAILNVPDLHIDMNMPQGEAKCSRVPPLLDLSIARFDPKTAASPISTPTSAVATTSPISEIITPSFWAARQILPIPLSKRIRTTEDAAKKQALQLQQQQKHQQKQTGDAIKLTPCHICHRRPTKKSDLEGFMDCAGCGARVCYICIRHCAGWAVPALLLDSDGEESLACVDADNMQNRSFCMEDAPPVSAIGDNSDITRDNDSHKNDTSCLGTARPEGADLVSFRDGGKAAQLQEQTHGWLGHGHCELVCSRCCVERGVDGDVMCLGCLAGSGSGGV